MNHRTPPYDAEQEEMVLGGCLGLWDGIDAAGQLTPEDFYVPAHRTVYGAMLALRAAGATIDVPAVTARLESTGRLAEAGGKPHLAQLAAQCPALSNRVRQAAGVVAEYARCRRAIAAGDALADAGFTGDPAEVDQALADLASLDTVAVSVEPPPEASTLVAHETPPDWVVTNLLARLEVVLMVAEPGAGKTTLLRQIAATVASGLHPFTRERITPRRVIGFDFQDPVGPAIRATREMLGCAGDSYRRTWWVELRQQGIDLTDPRDQAWFEAKVAAVDADLVIAGPLYNMVRGRPSRSKQSEETAEQAGRFLIDMLVRRNCALILEAHAPHGEELRVRGSKYWEDWAAFGFGLEDERQGDGYDRSLRVVRFRGDREMGRQWPHRFVQGRGAWPWDTTGLPTVVPDPDEELL